MKSTSAGTKRQRKQTHRPDADESHGTSRARTHQKHSSRRAHQASTRRHVSSSSSSPDSPPPTDDSSMCDSSTTGSSTYTQMTPRMMTPAHCHTGDASIPHPSHSRRARLAIPGPLPTEIQVPTTGHPAVCLEKGIESVFSWHLNHWNSWAPIAATEALAAAEHKSREPSARSLNASSSRIAGAINEFLRAAQSHVLRAASTASGPGVAGHSSARNPQAAAALAKATARARALRSIITQFRAEEAAWTDMASASQQELSSASAQVLQELTTARPRSEHPEEYASNSSYTQTVAVVDACVEDVANAAEAAHAAANVLGDATALLNRGTDAANAATYDTTKALRVATFSGLDTAASASTLIRSMAGHMLPPSQG